MPKVTNPNCYKARRYAKNVIAGKVIANKWINIACRQFLDDLERQDQPRFKYYFDEERAEKAARFIQLLPHVKGRWAKRNQLLNLEDWQQFFVCNLFGWYRKRDQLRRYRKAELYVGRKNGKSALAAAIALYCLAADGEEGAEVFAAATTKKQAWEVFGPAKRMAEKSDDFRDYYNVTVHAGSLTIDSNGSKYEPVIGDPPDGSSPSFSSIDEYHEHKTARSYDTMITGMGAREQPILLMITTAGDNLSGPCYNLQNQSQKILEGHLRDEERLILIYCADPGDDWRLLRTARKANPNLGISVSVDFIKARINDAKNSAKALTTYKTKHLNLWVGARDAYFNAEQWRLCEVPGIQLADYPKFRAWLGIDIASRVDLAALEILIDLERRNQDGQNLYARFGKYYLPEAALKQPNTEHLQMWADEGWITISPGEIIDQDLIKEDVIELGKLLALEWIAFDPFQATKFMTELDKQGLPVIQIRPTVLNFSQPMKELDAMIRTQTIQHNGDPVQAWSISNVTAQVDRKDNVYPTKAVEVNKIDPSVALIMAVNRAIQADDKGLDSAIDNFLSVKF